MGGGGVGVETTFFLVFCWAYIRGGGVVYMQGGLYLEFSSSLFYII